MPILKTLTVEQKTLAYHTVRGFTVRYREGKVLTTLQLYSWESPGAAAIGEDAESWQAEPAELEAPTLLAQGFEQALLVNHPLLMGGEYISEPGPADALMVAKQRKTAQINAARASAIAKFNQFSFEGVEYEGDEEAAQNIARLAGMARDGYAFPAGFSWRALNNSEIPMTADKLMALESAWAMAEGEHRLAQHMISRPLKDAIERATTLEALEAIQWPAQPLVSRSETREPMPEPAPTPAP
ncbi:DUF4376 domain-containing protein [Chitinimonas sp. BJB300]|uniref:DUF4376 domain-containing protein n=1 Tax=Chitinimonas sp. BJB300 TaxID=1559339 RepID=UPI000C110D6A|nr:DUF4376 domain-containing protein [Chitinimonas sp. BJB300]PHV10970.1 hypothetical protein CSQ89_13315 [Chitinimonas sp. BJB300]TSJ85953.1 DUF4376 domain-containing protein [Chitinimonas sp. BJB300]